MTKSFEIDVLIYKGIGKAQEPYIRLGHVGIIHPVQGRIYGFGPSTANVDSEDLMSGKVLSAGFSDHTEVFGKVLASGIPTIRLRTLCINTQAFFASLTQSNGYKYCLPDKRDGNIPAGAMNCVGAVRQLGILLPGTSSYIKDVLQNIVG